MDQACATTSFVYNLRIAETTKRAAFEQHHKDPTLATATIVGQFRKKYNGSHQVFDGGMGTLVYAPASYYCALILRLPTLVVPLMMYLLRVLKQMTCFFLAGSLDAASDQIKLTLSGLFGIPIHADTSLNHVQFGYGHFGLGVQGDGSFMLSEKSLTHSIRSALRLIHFFPRSVHIIDQPDPFNFNVGNLFDFYIAYHNNEHHYRFEIGYDLTILFDASLHPAFDDILKQTKYIRNSFYGSYKYRLHFYGYTSALTAALSYGFDSRPKEFGFRRIVTIWGSWEINF